MDPLVCPKCGGQMKIISFIEKDQSEVIEKILRHCGAVGGGAGPGPSSGAGASDGMKEVEGSQNRSVRGGLGKTMRTA